MEIEEEMTQGEADRDDVACIIEFLRGAFHNLKVHKALVWMAQPAVQPVQASVGEGMTILTAVVAVLPTPATQALQSHKQPPPRSLSQQHWLGLHHQGGEAADHSPLGKVRQIS